MTAIDELLQGGDTIVALLARDDIRRIRMTEELPNNTRLETFMVGPAYDESVEAHIVGWRVDGHSFGLPDWADTPDLDI